jgi:uncharacterized protein (TIGR00730 family)
LERVTVFCGSSHGARPEYAAAARALGKELASRGIGLVYGGGSVGLMGEVADAALSAGGEVVGVITEGLLAAEIAHPELSRLEVTASMHERKARMEALADGFIALPGGFGTWDELCEIVTWRQLGIHRKPVVLLDVADYWTPFLVAADHAVAEGFIRTAHREALRLATDPATAIGLLLAPVPAPVPKWVDGPRP